MEQSLEQLAGIGSSYRPQFRVAKVDNGDNKLGKNATGEFVIKTKNEAGEFLREKLGKNLEGIVLVAKARLSEKYDPNNKEPWWTDEFNPLNPNELVRIIKNKIVVKEMTYKEIKHTNQFIIQNTDGSVKNNFTYVSVVYVKIGSETLKFEFTGRSQGNWIDYSSKMNKAGKSLHKHVTRFKIVENKDGGFEAKFSSGAKVEDEEEIRSKVVNLLGTLGSGNLLAQSVSTPGISEPKLVSLPDDEPLPEEPGEDVNTFKNDDEPISIPF